MTEDQKRDLVAIDPRQSGIVLPLERGKPPRVQLAPRVETNHPRLSSFVFRYTVTGQQRPYTLEAEFQPEWVEDKDGNVLLHGLPGDRVQNNRATTHIVARGQRRVLVVEQKLGEQKFVGARRCAREDRSRSRWSPAR